MPASKMAKGPLLALQQLPARTTAKGIFALQQLPACKTAKGIFISASAVACTQNGKGNLRSIWWGDQNAFARAYAYSEEIVH